MRLVKRFVNVYGGTKKVSSREEADGVADHGTTVTLILKEADPVQ